MAFFLLSAAPPYSWATQSALCLSSYTTWLPSLSPSSRFFVLHAPFDVGNILPISAWPPAFPPRLSLRGALLTTLFFFSLACLGSRLYLLLPVPVYSLIASRPERSALSHAPPACLRPLVYGFATIFFPGHPLLAAPLLTPLLSPRAHAEAAPPGAFIWPPFAPLLYISPTFSTPHRTFSSAPAGRLLLPNHFTVACHTGSSLYWSYPAPRASNSQACRLSALLSCPSSDPRPSEPKRPPSSRPPSGGLVNLFSTRRLFHVTAIASALNASASYTLPSTFFHRFDRHH